MSSIIQEIMSQVHNETKDVSNNKVLIAAAKAAAKAEAKKASAEAKEAHKVAKAADKAAKDAAKAEAKKASAEAKEAHKAAKAADKAAKAAAKATAKTMATDVNPAAGIATFFQPSTRAENDAANKLREKILEKMCDPPKEYLDHPEFGASWRIVHEQWNDALARVAANTLVPAYTSTSIEMKGGRKFNYDAIVTYYNEGVPVANQNIEFKYGGTNIGALPQFLSLQAKMKLFDKTYDEFWYERYLDQYLACDLGLTEAKPSLETYLKRVTSTVYSITPFFAKLKERELLFQDEKNEVVDRSITDYLTIYGTTMNVSSFEEKVQATQRGKIYLLWSDGAFHIDSMSETETSNLTFHSIRNGNVLELKAGNALYGLLLRWRNHKGILNPAWQISMKRTIE
jgi:hypothetical protein